MHVVVWGSILVWFVVIPVTSAGVLYSSFFRYGGVAYEVLNTAAFWFYLPLSTVVALFPTMISRLINLYRYPAYVDFVRLKEKNEGKKLFKRRKMTRRPATTHSMKRSGYAFSHQEGYGEMITTGHIFGMDEGNVAAEHLRRRSVLLSASPSRAGTELLQPGSSHFAAAAAASLSAAVVGIDSRSSITIEVVEDLGSVGDEKQASSIPRDTASRDNDCVAAPPSHEETHEDEPEAEFSEQTDSALMPPPLRIPGLVDSPDEVVEDKDADTAGDQTTPPGDGEKVDDDVTVV